MGKKNPFVFTIGFDKSDPDHVYVTELLNTTEKKAKLIVAAILAYTGRTDETGNGSISMEPDMLRPMMQQIIREEVRKVLEGQDVSKINREMPTEVDLMEEEPLRMDQTMRQNVVDAIAFINREANIYGDAVIAGMGAVTRITSMGTLVVFGFLKGFQPIAGFSYGAKKFDRLREAIKTSILWSTIFCVVVGLTIALFSTQIISQFTEGNTEMISVGQKSLMANGFSFFVFGFYTVYSSLFLALGKGTAGFVLGACRQGICFVPIILLLPSFWGINGILYAQPIADVISAIVTVFMALHLHKELATTKEH